MSRQSLSSYTALRIGLTQVKVCLLACLLLAPGLSRAAIPVSVLDLHLGHSHEEACLQYNLQDKVVYNLRASKDFSFVSLEKSSLFLSIQSEQISEGVGICKTSYSFTIVLRDKEQDGFQSLVRDTGIITGQDSSKVTQHVRRELKEAYRQACSKTDSPKFCSETTDNPKK